MGRLKKKIQIVMGVILYVTFKSALCQIKPESMSTFKIPISKEKIALQSNTNILLAGDAFYYKLYCLNTSNKLSTASKIVYVELIGENESLFKHKLKLVGGMASGDFFTPSNAKTGNYKLVAYTKWMHNNNSNPFYQTNLYIINPFISNDEIFNEEEGFGNSSVEIKKGFIMLDNNHYDISIQANRNFYGVRERVELELNNALGEANFGNYSLSVRKLDSIEITNKDIQENSINKKSEFYLPEIRSEIISGQVVSKVDNSFVENKIVALSIPGKNYIYKNVKTDKQGKFYFSVSENYNDTYAIIQALDENKENYKLLLEDSSFKFYEQLEFSRIKLHTNIKEWLLKRSIYNQIENAYHNSKKDSIIYRKPSKVFYGNPTISYLLDDYKRFSTVRETFVEVIEEAAIRKSNDSYTFKVYNYEELRNNAFRDYHPLLLMDGILIQNSSDILNYDCNKIECVNVVRGIYFYGPSIFNGIIDIKTKEGDFNLPKNREGNNYFNLQALEENKIYYAPNYKDRFENLKRIPDYRTQLLWNPNLSLNSSTKTLEFYTSDITGVFEIILEGFTLGGRYKTSKGYIRVQN